MLKAKKVNEMPIKDVCKLDGFTIVLYLLNLDLSIIGDYPVMPCLQLLLGTLNNLDDPWPSGL